MLLDPLGPGGDRRFQHAFYVATVHPTDHVDVIVHNDEPRQPVWETRTR